MIRYMYILISQNKQLTKINTYLRKQIREAKRKDYEHIFSLYKNDIKRHGKFLTKPRTEMEENISLKIFFIKKRISE